MSTQITVNDGGKSKGGRFSLWLNLILITLLIASWVTRPEISDPELIHTVETVVETDTVYVDRALREVSLKVDTVFVHEVVIDTVLVDNGLPGGNNLSPLRTYFTSFADSLIFGRMTSLVRGELLEQKLFYKPVYPAPINTIITVTDSSVERIIVRQSFIQAGLELGIVDAGLQVNPMVGYTHKTGHSVFYRYTPWNGGSHSIGFLTPIKIPWLNL
jgi:hypothetical protein